jgi:hypothetical protein
MPILASRGAGSAKGFGLTAGGSPFICATGGTVTTCGNYKVHTFTSPGTFTVSKAGLGPTNNVDYFVVAGGGGGGNNGYPANRAGGSGGGGGFRLSNFYGLPAPTMSPLSNPTGIPVTATAYPITVGAGGAGGIPANCSPDSSGRRGSSSIFSTITSTGGGGGEGHPLISGGFPPSGAQMPGGSGAGNLCSGAPVVGRGNNPPTSPPQGYDPGDGFTASPSNWQSGGGGGAGGVGGTAAPSVGGKGGIGGIVNPAIGGANGTTGPVPGVRYFSGGGGGINAGAAPDGGGGTAYSSGTDGTANSGGGGGGRPTGSPASAGGSGIVVIRYQYK